ncbi:hypothetical protein AMAG_02958 [Allomyces macrogynus ATCC 38327]|uniref:Cytochrome c oxidase assembly protein n=1 Tax=Allomyces macrogynus (strain ATCC 38327) TaxID=578462 RepID=A0A0L0S495_ALLM3|nr:hypothetical protein AMAG_02958 [Allomyces macrogynus ATCC 38327]|eukprot:KNE57221.1 hypothetical protein AMAG_02958 [Allomyces macrogynus ATCC 38327]
MSAAAKVTLAGSILFTIASVSAVHWQHIKERERMHEGVLRDEERLAAKQRQDENARDLAAQQALERELRAQQEMESDTTTIPTAAINAPMVIATPTSDPSAPESSASGRSWWKFW